MQLELRDLLVAHPSLLGQADLDLAAQRLAVRARELCVQLERRPCVEAVEAARGAGADGELRRGQKRVDRERRIEKVLVQMAHEALVHLVPASAARPPGALRQTNLDGARQEGGNEQRRDQRELPRLPAGGRAATHTDGARVQLAHLGECRLGSGGFVTKFKRQAAPVLEAHDHLGTHGSVEPF